MSTPTEKVEANSVRLSINADLLWKVLELTFLHPLFAVFSPLLALSQGHSKNSQPFLGGLLYFVVTLFIWGTSFISRIYLNKIWKSPSWVASAFARPTLNWRDQIVVVTGGAGGLGSVLVETIAIFGATVVVVDRVKYEPQYGDVYTYVCDFTSDGEIDKVIKQIHEEVGHPTILINNAGTLSAKLILDMTVQDLEKTFKVNLFSQFTFVKAFLPEMINQNAGHIVTVASIYGFMTTSQLSDYCASKHGCVALHETIRDELTSRYGSPCVRTTLVAPGRIATPLFESLHAPNLPTQFLMPTVDPHDVAKLIITALETETSQDIFLPRFGATLWMWRGYPSWMRALMHYVSGANHAMKAFTTKQKTQ